MKILVTGANGFVGTALVKQLILQNYQVCAAVRRNQEQEGITSVEVGEIGPETNWASALEGVDVVIHLAARVHMMRDSAKNPLDEFRKVNVEGTRHLAELAVKAGVKRFVFVSSIKANGEESGKVYAENDKPRPKDDYGVSKWEAEQVLHDISTKIGLEIVIIRPPLVYGAGVKGNFAQMMNILAKGFPLPFASIKNLRSFIFVENLVDALILCAEHPSAAGQTYFVSDGEDISTPDLISRLSNIMGKNVLIFPCPLFLLRLVAKLMDKDDQVQRLSSNLQVDSSKIRKELDWKPPYTLQDGLIMSIRMSSDNEIGV